MPVYVKISPSMYFSATSQLGMRVRDARTLIKKLQKAIKCSKRKKKKKPDSKWHCCNDKERITK